MRGFILSLAIAGLFSMPGRAGLPEAGPPITTDVYQISFGPQILAIPGDPQLFIPIRINVTRPVIAVRLTLNYDASLLTPTLLAPNMFFQSFTYDITRPGRIRMDLTTDLPPPPYIPPLFGDTLFAWISCHVSSRYIGFEYLTQITYFEDPYTPLPDNYVMFDNGDIIGGPILDLVNGNILIWFPLYGDINLNGYPYEIADAVTFFNFFMGYTRFNRRQYANSDCNHDGAQASISDLVFLLRVINGDTSLTAPPTPLPPAEALARPLATSGSALTSYDGTRNCDMVVDAPEALGGARFILSFDSLNIQPTAVLIDPAAGYMQLASSVCDGQLIVTITNWDAAQNSFAAGRLFSIAYSASSGSTDEPFTILGADFSDNRGYPLSADYSMKYEGIEMPVPKRPTSLTLSGYPNPFNNAVAISYDIPAGGNYQMAIYDILGRRVKTMFDEFKPAGQGTVIWNATDDSKTGVASGPYFMRLQGEGGANSIKLFLLK